MAAANTHQAEVVIIGGGLAGIVTNRVKVCTFQKIGDPKAGPLNS